MADVWIERALCATRIREGLADADWWSPRTKKSDGVRRALAICAACDVAHDCAQMAEALGASGIWGGAIRIASENRRTGRRVMQ